jgi:sterol desaturase/sphingolipid hydroxylase (fatty acid hydroxylase superfamily)
MSVLMGGDYSVVGFLAFEAMHVDLSLFVYENRDSRVKKFLRGIHHEKRLCMRKLLKVESPLPWAFLQWFQCLTALMGIQAAAIYHEWQQGGLCFGAWQR